MKNKFEKGIIGYEEGIPVVAVPLIPHREGNLLRLLGCPYCGLPHLHGAPEGHRVAHCDWRAYPQSSPGYILRIQRVDQ
jgi:hypothetical protein